MLKGLLGLSSNIFACVGVSISARTYICGEQNTSVPHEQAFSERVFKDTGVSRDPVRGSGNASVDVSLSSVPPFLSDGFIRLGNECRVPNTENLAPRPPGGSSCRPKTGALVRGRAMYHFIAIHPPP